MNGDESLHQKSTLLRVWGSEFGIPNWYTGLKIALDMAQLTEICSDITATYGNLFQHIFTPIMKTGN